MSKRVWSPRAREALKPALIALLIFVLLDWAGYSGKFTLWDDPRPVMEVLSHLPFFLLVGLVFFLISFVLESQHGRK
jgi:hypothetical protein